MLVPGITVQALTLVHLMPGSPVTQYEFNPVTRPEDIKRNREQLGLNQPVYIRSFQRL